MEFPSADQGYQEAPPFSVEAGELGGAGTGSVKTVLLSLYVTSDESSIDGTTFSPDSSDCAFARDFAVLERALVDFRGLPIRRNGLYTQVVP